MLLKQALVLIAVLHLACVWTITEGTSVPFHRYYNGVVHDHLYTTDSSIIHILALWSKGYGYEGIQCCVESNKVPLSVPLYRWYHNDVGDTFYTVNEAAAGFLTLVLGYEDEGIAAYCFPFQVGNTIPLHRYYHGVVFDHFYTTEPTEIGTTTVGEAGNYGYVYEGVACYVYPLTYCD